MNFGGVWFRDVNGDPLRVRQNIYEFCNSIIQWGLVIAKELHRVHLFDVCSWVILIKGIFFFVVGVSWPFNIQTSGVQTQNRLYFWLLILVPLQPGVKKPPPKKYPCISMCLFCFAFFIDLLVYVYLNINYKLFFSVSFSSQTHYLMYQYVLPLYHCLYISR